MHTQPAYIGGMSDPAKHVVDLFGGIHPLSRALGHKNPTTVQGWFERGVIPARQMPKVLAAARREGIELTAEQLIPEPESA